MTTTSPFQRLFQPIKVGPMELKNRIVMAPMGTNLASQDGYVTQRMIDYYAERAKGGVGLLIVEIAIVHSSGKHLFGELAVDDDRFIPGLRELAQAVKGYGAKIGIQIAHAGREAKSAMIHTQPVAPSPVISWAVGSEMPRELTVAEISDLVICFAQAAERAQRAGFDGVELHASHYYLIAQFLSAASNQRRDAYGGSLENRARFLLEIIEACRRRTGKGFAVWCRLNGCEYGFESGITLAETQVVSRLAEEAGADAIHVTAVGKGAWVHLPFTRTAGEILPLAEGVKRAVKIPVMAVGCIEPELGEKVLQEKKADLISFGRPLLADPEIADKAASGRLDEVVPCIGCLECLRSILFLGKEVVCSVNPAVGKERESQITPAARAKRVLVVGGGPAGLEAAIVAALRGHQVLLYEKSSRLGGQLEAAARPPYKERIERLIWYLTTQVKKLGVVVELGKEVSPELVAEIKPDAVVVATGVAPFIPDIPGIDSAGATRAEDVLLGKKEVGKRVAIIGGGMVGCETAEFLVDGGRKVTVIEMLPRLAMGMMPHLRRELLDRLATKGVALLTSAQCQKVSPGKLDIVTREGEALTIEVDTVILAAGARPNQELLQALNGKVPEVYAAGDCVEPRTIMEAMADGWRVARNL